MLTEKTSKFRKAENGGVALIFGLVTPFLIGIAGLGVDTTYWMMERNKLQAATDSAAISAAQSIALNADNAGIAAEAKKILTKTYGISLAGVRHTVQHPPASGALAGDATAVAILTEKDQPIFFLGLFGVKNSHVATRAVAKVDQLAEACLVALSNSEDKAIEITGNTTISLGCGIASNSNSSQAAYFSGSSDVSTTGVSTVGDIYQTNNAKLDTNGGPLKTNAQAIVDPYGPEGRNLQVPKQPAGCAEKNLKVQSNTTLSPGRYCGGIDFTGGTATFEPGVYIIDGGDFKANGGATLVGEDVTFVLTGKSNKIAQLDVNGGAQVALHAPKSGTSMDGILFFQDPDGGTPHGSQSKLNGTADLDLSGALYFPNEKLEISGGSASNISCLQIIADTIKISGNSKITSTCDKNAGTESLKRVTVELVE